MNVIRFFENKGNESTLLPYINRGYAHYANGAFGEIFVTPNYEAYFKPMKLIDGTLYESMEEPILLGSGFIAYYIANDEQDLDATNNEYFSISLQKYIQANKKNTQMLREAKEVGWKSLFFQEHIKKEKELKEKCANLFSYLSQDDKDNILDVFDYYIERLYLDDLYHDGNKYDILSPLSLDADWTNGRKDILIKAIAREYVKIDGIHLKWKLSKALLDFFIGKLFCNDVIKEIKPWSGIYKWDHSAQLKNANRLCELFQEKNIGSERRNGHIPNGWQDIDKLWPTENN